MIHRHADPSPQRRGRTPGWTRACGAAMYTLAALWLVFIFLQGGFIHTSDQPAWVHSSLAWGSAVIGWHLVLGYDAYRARSWVRWGLVITGSVYLCLLLIYLCVLFAIPPFDP